MSATVSTQATPGQPTSSLAAVPRAIWIALGALAIATAGMGGALVMRAIDRAEPVTAQVSTQSATPKVDAFSQQAPQPPAVQPSQLQAAPAVQPAPAQPAPVKVAKPAAPKPAPVQQATGSATQNGPAAQVVAQQQPIVTTPVQARPAVCNSCGTVQYVQEVKEKGPSTGLGAAGGAVLGGLLGNQVGDGNGKKIMTGVGAAGGAFAGHEAEKHVRATTAYDVQVRMEDGSVRTFRRAQPVAVGTRVTVEGNTMRVGGQSSGGAVPATVAPRTLQTSAPASFGG